MSYSQVTISSGVISERVGDELLVIVPGRTGTVRLTGYAADLFLDIRAGTKVDTADLVVADLVDLGITQASGMSRRGLIKAGAIGAGAGVAVLAMPGVAAAASTAVIRYELGSFSGSLDPSGSGMLYIGSGSGHPVGVTNGYAGVWVTSNLGINVAVAYNSGFGEWVGTLSDPGVEDFTEYQSGTLYFTFEGLDYEGFK
jgi:hypothetical protein